ncbi:MAG TPA: cyclic nucleotide-binding domain-containing protein [Candidatus Binatia bacterium]|nr:cyclic nucleotide-binding domain-containing protein [Candidatus Binatia bacterium]
MRRVLKATYNRRTAKFQHELGKVYVDGEDIVRQGEKGDALYVILEGEVEVVVRQGTTSRRLAILGEGDFFGEMEIFDSRRICAENETVA